MEKTLGEKFGVQGFPTLKFFRKGKATEYTGGRTSDTIIAWVEKKTGPPAKTLENVEDAKAFIEANDIAIVGFFKDVESVDAKTFIDAAGSMDDYPFGLASKAAVLDEYKVETSRVVLFKNFDEGRNDFTGEVSEEAILSFVSSNALPLVADFNQETAQKMFSVEVKSILLLCISASAEEYSAKVEIARGIAKDLKGEMHFITINVDEKDNKRILDFFGVEVSELPSMRIVLKREDNMENFNPESTELNLHTCIPAYLHTCILAYLHTCILAYWHIGILAYLHNCIFVVCIPA